MFEARPTPAHRRTRALPIIRARSSVAGRTSVRFLDGDGQPSLVDLVYGDGRVRRVHELPWRPNLLLNTGLDYLCATAGTNSVGDLMRERLAVGTGSTAPSASQIALAAEAQDASTSGTGAVSVANVVGSNLVEAVGVSRRVTMTANRNLTEYGFRAASGDIRIRELFRDELGDPVTISMLSGKTIEVNHQLIYTLPLSGMLATFDIDELDAGDNLVSSTSYDVEAGFMRNTGLSLNLGARAWAEPGRTGGQTNGVTLYRVTSAVTFPYNFTGGSLTDLANAIQFGSRTLTPETYSAGTFKRVRTITIETDAGSGNGVYYGIAFGISASSSAGSPRLLSGFGIRFDDPTTFTKLATHTLTLGVEMAVARS